MRCPRLLRGMAPRRAEIIRAARVRSCPTTTPMLGVGPGQSRFRRVLPRSGDTWRRTSRGASGRAADIPQVFVQNGARAVALAQTTGVEGSMFVQVTATIRATTQCRRSSRARTRGLRFKSGPAVALEERDVIRVVVECVLVALVCSVCPLAWAPTQWAACVQAEASDARHRTSRRPKTYESDVVIVIYLPALTWANAHLAHAGASVGPPAAESGSGLASRSRVS